MPRPDNEVSAWNFEGTGAVIDPFSPMSEQRQISPYGIDT